MLPREEREKKREGETEREGDEEERKEGRNGGYESGKKIGKVRWGRGMGMGKCQFHSFFSLVISFFFLRGYTKREETKRCVT